MDLIEFSDQMGKQVKEHREQAKAEQAKVEQAKQEALKQQKQHEENKKQGML